MSRTFDALRRAEQTRGSPSPARPELRGASLAGPPGERSRRPASRLAGWPARLRAGWRARARERAELRRALDELSQRVAALEDAHRAGAEVQGQLEARLAELRGELARSIRELAERSARESAEQTLRETVDPVARRMRSIGLVAAFGAVAAGAALLLTLRPPAG